MQLENSMAFAKTEIICHGARATRIGERLIRHVWKYLKETEFVKGNISKNEREEMFNSIFLTSLISYPDDVENLATGCDIIFQIVFGESESLTNAVKLAQEKFKNVPSITFLLNEQECNLENVPYINVSESEIIDTFLDIFSVYTFPQEYGADFEELKPLLDHKGKISTEKGEDFNLCVIRKATKEESDLDVIQNTENSKGSFIIASRIEKERKIKYYNI